MFLTICIVFLALAGFFFIKSNKQDDKVFGEAKERIKKTQEEGKWDSQNVSVMRNAIGKISGNDRSYKNGDRLTEFELQWMRWRLKKELPACVDCEVGDLLEGPSGGICVNVLCSNKLCGSKFNICGPMGVDRITDASPNKPREMVTLGPHR